MNDSRPWWLWPNLLALDAPAVAVVWQVFLASVAGVVVPLAASVVLALVVWGVYLADRGLDARRGTDTSDRHRAAARNATAWFGTAVVALITAVILSVAALPDSYLRAGIGVGVAAACYFAAVHVVCSERVLSRGVKEASVGFVFAAGAAIPLIAEAEGRTDWIPGAVAFAGLCWLNCLLISWWECGTDAAPEVWAVGAAFALAVGATVGAASPVACAVVLGTAALAVLHLLRFQLSVRASRVLADAVLLSPLLVAAY